MGLSFEHNLARPEPQALAGTIEALAARFGNRLVTSQAVREQHAHTTTWLASQPPDAVVMATPTTISSAITADRGKGYIMGQGIMDPANGDS